MLRAAFLLSTCRSSVKRLAEVAGGLRFVSGSTAYWSCRKVPRRQKAGIRQDWQLGESENHWHLNLGAKHGEFWCGFCPTLGRHTQIHFIMVDFRIGLRNNLYDYYIDLPTNLRVKTTWWLIPLSKWVITPVISGLTLLIPFITGVITHLLSGMSHQVTMVSLFSCRWN